MSAKIIDGSALARRIRQALAARAAAVQKARGRPPRLVAVAAAESAAAAAYVQAKLKACLSVGIEAAVHSMPSGATQAEAMQFLGSLNRDDSVDAVILDLPLPPGIDPRAALEALSPEKDAEGVTPLNFGRLMLAKSYAEIEAERLIAPCTALAVAALLKETGVPAAGKRAAVVGRSGIVGRPAAHLLSALDATVTLCHSRTPDLEEEVRRADIVVAAVGQAGIIRGSWIKKGAVVIDAGVNPDGNAIRGDVEFPAAAEAASYITPVPGGVGPVTTAMLLSNAVALAERRLPGAA